MSEENSELLSEFEEFLAAKREKENKAKQEEDFDVEIWDEKGRGVRTKRSHAKPFLQSLGLDTDETAGGKDDGDGKGNSKDKGDGKTRNSTGKQTQNQTSTSIAQKYFTRDKK